jgi:hypothetical protein
MFMLSEPSRTWALEGVARHTCAVGGVDFSISQRLRKFANPEIEMR